MTTCREEQLEELEALASVFDAGHDRLKYSTDSDRIRGSISIEFEPLSTPAELYITNNEVRKSVKVNAFSPAVMKFSLPEDYPSTSTPLIEVECIWMSQELLDALASILKEQCESMLGMGVLFLCCQAIIDAVRERELDLREICLDSTPYILKYNLPRSDVLKLITESCEKSEDHNFETGCYDCEVCFDNKMGKDCIKVTPCGHVFCADCVECFIRERTRGTQVKAITCLMDGCDCPIPQTIIYKFIGEEEFERYERILLESALCQMKDVVTCPRKSCQKNVVLSEQNPKLGSCSVCSYSFCAICRRAYHGIAACRLSIENREKLVKKWLKASEAERQEMGRMYGGIARLRTVVEGIQNETWIESNSKPCPHCHAAIEKNNGCNKMICTKCQSAFCWLCDKKLPVGDPYSHFREGGQCANRLFEGSLNDFEEFPEEWDSDEEEDDTTDSVLQNARDILIEFDIAEILQLRRVFQPLRAKLRNWWKTDFPEDYDSDDSVLSLEGAIYFGDVSDDD